MLADLPPYDPPESPYVTYLYEDEDVIFVNKPSGLLSVPGKAESMKDCLEYRVQEKYPAATIVHRLDMETSGVMVLARHKDAHRHLSAQFEHRHVNKVYEALVWGVVEHKEGQVDEPLICDWPNRPLQKICYETGKPARTRFKRLSVETAPKGAEYCTRIALFPETGRSHQLRVHMQHLNHPICGDRLYAYGHTVALKAADRLCLHAKELEITHPMHSSRLTVKAPVPF